MATLLSRKNIVKNLTLSIGVQALSVMVGFILNLVVPKFISEYDYSYWQSFLLYSQYLGILHFGLMDGIILRYSQYDYGELDKRAVRSQYLYVMAADLFLSLLLLLYAAAFLQGVRRVLGILLACTICIEITYNYISFTFQITNRIARYSAYIAVYRIIYCLLTVLCLLTGWTEYFWFCIAYLIADAAVIVYFGYKYSRELLLGPLLPFRQACRELRVTLSAGVWLMLSSYAANFLIGSGKMIIQWRWGTLAFGKTSLAFSLSSFVLQFVTAISVVLFPTIKRMDPEKLPEMYGRLRCVISPVLFLAMLFFYPGCRLLELWLPKYADSIRQLGILLPIVIYTSKVSLLTNNYLKAYRRERSMLFVNAGAVLLGLLLFSLCAWVLNSLTILLFAIVFMIMLRSVVSEILVMKAIGGRLWGDFAMELVLTLTFIYSAVRMRRWQGALLYAAVLCAYLTVKRRDIRKTLRALKNF